MKLRVILPLSLATVLGASAALGVQVGDSLPAIQVAKFEGKTQLEPAALKGKVTVINFWATWCEACKVEIREMEDVFRAYTAEDDFQLAFVSLDKKPKNAAEWFKRRLKDPQGFLDYLYVDPKFTSADKMQIESFPMTVVVDRSGKIRHIQRGFKKGEGSTEEIAKKAQALLSQGA